MSDADFGNKSLSIGQRRYLGGKRKLLGFIDSILKKEKVNFKSFADIFSGTGVVAEYFYPKADIIVNDILESNYQAYNAYFGSEQIRETWLKKKITEFNQTEADHIKPNYFSKNFSGTYFNEENSRRIGYIRDTIETLYREKLINLRERSYLIISLMYALDSIANTVGHYDAYRKTEPNPKKLILRPLFLINSTYNASIHKKDANDLVKEIKADVVYIDPPYNSRQYSDLYHLLENIVEWKEQNVHGIAKKIDRAHIKSDYSLKSAANAFSDLISSIDAKYILISYNDMGNSGAARSQSRISDYEILSALKRRGRVTIYETHFNQFTTGISKKDDLKERVFFCRVGKELVDSTPVTSDKNTHLPEFIKSPLNYTGGKHKLLSQLSLLFPPNVDTFYDVFCGGANVGINAKAKHIVCIDKNVKVIQILDLLKNSNFEQLHQSLISLINNFNLSQSYIHGYERYESQSSTGLGTYNKKGFQLLRDTYNAGDVTENRIYLLLLILYGFNNQIRFNMKGEFNLPVGKRDYNGSSRKNIANFNAIANQKDVTFKQGDFRDLRSIKFKRNDFVYLDPPYLLGLASYNESHGWSEKDEIELYKILDLLNKKGVRFALSNVTEHKGKKNNHLLNWAKKNGHTVHSITHNYHNSNYQSKAKNSITREVLIKNY